MITAAATGYGESIHQVDLARGPAQLLILPDETRLDDCAEDASRLARHVHLELPRAASPYRYRLMASIALAEAARQVGTG